MILEPSPPFLEIDKKLFKGAQQALKKNLNKV